MYGKITQNNLPVYISANEVKQIIQPKGDEKIELKRYFKEGDLIQAMIHSIAVVEAEKGLHKDK